MKKIYKVILALLIFTTSSVYACPHSDKFGQAHFQFYNEDYTEMIMMYPRDKHIYAKTVPMDTTANDLFKYEDDIIDESYGFPLLQDEETYKQNYWFIDDSIFEEGAQFETTVEGTDSLLVTNIDYKLNVGLKNTFLKHKSLLTEYSNQILYNVLLDRVDTTKDNKYSRYLNKINLNLKKKDILNINAEYMITTITNNEYATEYRKINQLEDEIKVYIKSENFNTDIIVLNLNDVLTENSYIETIYNNGFYEFNINKPGSYVLVDKNSYTSENLDFFVIKQVSVDDFADEEKISDEESDQEKESFDISKHLPILIIIPVIISLIVVVIILNKKKK